MPDHVPLGVPLKVDVRTKEESSVSYLDNMDYSTLTGGLVPKAGVGNGPGSAFSQSNNLPLAPPEAGVAFSNGANFTHLQVQGGPPVALGAELPCRC